MMPALHVAIRHGPIPHMRTQLSPHLLALGRHRVFNVGSTEAFEPHRQLLHQRKSSLGDAQRHGKRVAFPEGMCPANAIMCALC